MLSAPSIVYAAETAAALEKRSLDANTIWDLQHLTLAALRFHPDLDVARAHAAVMHAAEVTAAARPDPTINAIVEHKAEPGKTPWITSLGFDLTIETANKRGLRTRQARDASRAADFAIADQAWTIRSGVRAQLVALLAEAKTLHGVDAEIVEYRPTTGGATETDPDHPVVAAAISAAQRHGSADSSPRYRRETVRKA